MDPAAIHEFHEYPKMLYHRRLAPQGKAFQTEAETAGLAAAGWVDTPGKFPKLSELSLAELKADYDAADEQYRLWTSGGACEPGSPKWEEVTATYNACRDRYQFALREAELAKEAAAAFGTKAKRRAQTFQTTFSTFTVRGVLGEGGNGTVFEVADYDGEIWAVKCLKPEAVTRNKARRFKNEIAFCAEAKHPNIIKVADWGLAEVSGVQVPFYVMPRFPSTLRTQMRGGVAPQNVLGWFDQLLAGLEAAHALGVWHRDLKPENLLCDPSRQLLVITDFGIAHFAESLLETTVKTQPNERVANFQYAAPEQRVSGPVDQRADIYACGLILNELFTGAVLQGTHHRTIGSVAPGFAHLDSLVEEMVRQSPEERPASVKEVRSALGLNKASASVQKGGHPNVEAGVAPGRAGGNPAAPLNSATVFDRLKLFILEWADRRYPESQVFDPARLSREFDLTQGYIEEFMEEMDRDGLVTVSRWDGQRMCPLRDWPNPGTFFHQASDVYVRMRRAGKAALLNPQMNT